MRMVDPSLLREIAINSDPVLVVALAGPLASEMAAAELNTPLRIAHFLAQCCEESRHFTRMEENMRYSEKRIPQVWPRLAPRAAELAGNPEALANAAYAGQYGNESEASGDGWRYRGRGLLDHTFRDNFSELQSALNVPLLTEPDMLLQPEIAVRAAVYFFKARGCIPLADQDDVREITIKVSGSASTVADRAILKHRALTLLKA